MGAKPSSFENEPDVTGILEQDVDEQDVVEELGTCFLGIRGIGLKPIASPLTTSSKARRRVASRENHPTRYQSDGISEAVDGKSDRSAPWLSGGSAVRQLNGCNDDEMARFLSEIFEADETSGKTSLASPQRKSCGHRRQRIHEANEVSLGTHASENMQIGSPSDLTTTSRPSLGQAMSISDSEASTPCASPISLHGCKETMPILKEEVLLEDPSLCAPLSNIQDLGRMQELFKGEEPSPLPLLPPDLVSPVGKSASEEEDLWLIQGPDHKLRLRRQLLQNLGDQMERQGKLEDALQYYELCFEHDDVLQTSLKDKAVVHLKIGIVYWKLSSYHESLDALNCVLSIYESAFGPDWLEQSPNFVNATSFSCSETFLMLGRAHLSLGDSEQARYHVKQCLSLLTTSHLEHDVIHPIFARGLHSLGMTYEASGRHSKALNYYYEALAMQREVYGDSHVDVAASLAAIGSLQEKFGTYDKAMKCFVDALSIYEAQPGEGSCQVDIGSILSRIGWVCFIQGHDDSAMEAYEESVANIAASLGPRHRNVASVRVQIGMVHERYGRPQEALAALKAALAGQRKAFGDLHVDVVITLDALATSYNSLDKPRKSIAALDQALHIQRQLLGKSHLDVGKTFARLGNLYVKTKHDKLAKQCYGNALKIFKANRLPADDKRLVGATKSLHELILYIKNQLPKSVHFAPQPAESAAN